jgi:predicted naringenin-chalcone synthase
MYLTGLGTATPPSCYSQAQCWAALAASPLFERLDRRAQFLLEQVLHGDNGIATRYLTPSPLTEIFDATPDRLQGRFVEHAPSLAAAAGQRALRDADLENQAIDAVIVSTCTGYLCPGLSSYVVERLGLRTDVIALDLVGQGCAAALPNWMMADALLGSRRANQVLSICVEVCSAAFYMDNDPGVLISACLFGDGAGAAVLANAPRSGMRSVRWLQAASLLNPGERDALRFEQVKGMLRNILTRPVPRLAAEHAERVLQCVLGARRIAPAEIATWIWHAGGRDVLLALEERLKLNPEQTRFSRETLAEYGNLSSAFVYFVLAKALAAQAPAGYWWLSSFGAGFSCHGALLEVT